MINRFLLLLGLAAAIIAVCLCARSSRSVRYVRYSSTRYTRYTSYSSYRYNTYGSRSGGGVIAGYVVGGIVGVIILAAVIYFFYRHVTRNKRRVHVQPRLPPQNQNRLIKRQPHIISGPVVKPPPYPGHQSTYPENAHPPGFNPSYYPPPPPYSQATVGQPLPGDPAYPPPPPVYNPAPMNQPSAPYQAGKF